MGKSSSGIRIGTIFTVEDCRDFNLTLDFEVNVSVDLGGWGDNGIDEYDDEVELDDIRCIKAVSEDEIKKELTELENYLLCRWFRIYWLADSENWYKFKSEMVEKAR